VYHLYWYLITIAAAAVDTKKQNSFLEKQIKNLERTTKKEVTTRRDTHTQNTKYR